MLRGDSQDPIRRIEELHVTEISCCRLDNRCQELRNRCALCGAEIRVVIDSLPAVRTSRVSRQWIVTREARANKPLTFKRSEERRVGKESRTEWSPRHTQE